MNQKLFFISCMRYLEIKGELPYQITNKHYNSDIYLGAKDGLDDAEMVFLFFDKEKPNTTSSIAIEENPLKLSPDEILRDLVKSGEVEVGYSYCFLYLDGDIYINYNEDKTNKITKDFIKSTNRKIIDAKERELAKTV